MLVFALVLSACTPASAQLDEASAVEIISGTANEGGLEDVTEQTVDTTAQTISASYDETDLETNQNSADLAAIQLDEDSISVDSDGAVVDGSTVTIVKAGMYSISGILNDGQVIIDTEDEEVVTLVLNGTSITSSTSAPIYIRNADKTVLTLAEGSENFVTDGASYVFTEPESSEPNAAIFSNDDLTINGTGSLVVSANYKNGIVSNDDLKITAGTLTIYAVNDGIKGKDSLAILDGSITIDAGGDGLKAYNDEDAEQGYVVIDGGVFHITAALDGIQAETQLSISNGDFNIIAGEGSANAVSTQSGMDRNNNQNTATQDNTNSTKGMKAGSILTITDGTFIIDSADDALHANIDITIDSGDFALSSGDDGIHADNAVIINGGNIKIARSYEGIESANLTINNGSINIVSIDDGFNAVSASGWGGESDDGSILIVNGGYIVMYAGGDGFDSNGSGIITGGTFIVHGAAVMGNGPVDVNGTLTVSGGLLVAVGSANMADTPDNTSTQNSIAMVLNASQPAGSLIHIENENGQDILTFVPSYEYQYVVVSSPELQTNETYNIYIGGSSTGSDVDGLIENGETSSGSLVSNVTLTSTVTALGDINSSMGGGRQKGNRP